MKHTNGVILLVVVLVVLVVLALFNPTIPVLMLPKDKTVAKDSSWVDSVDWSPVENQPLAIDMEKMNVVLVKRTMNGGKEATLIRYQSGSDEYFACSKEIHGELVKKLQEILNKRESGN
jgi:hypothetical protein